MKIEWWKYINDYEGLYMVSTFGRVKNCKTGRILKLCVNNCGYLQVCLSKNSNLKSYLVHRLVAESFIPNQGNLPTVDHINRDKTDNRVENLRWASYKLQCENSNRTNQLQGIKTNCSKPVLQYTKEMEFVWEYPSIIEASRQTGIERCHILSCCKRRRKSAGGYVWMYKV